jgi:mono/diheme cytochrome c family protein
MMRPILLLILFLGLNTKVFAASDNDSMKYFLRGRETFRTYCGACHNVHKEIVGPMLGSITKKRTQEWLTHFIRNSQEVIASGDEYATFIYQQYNHTVMPSFEELGDQQINDILYYIETESLHPKEQMDNGEDVPENGNTEILKGREIFVNQCSPCHFIEKENASEGPALGSVNKRRPKEWLIPFIKNSQHVIKSGDPYAVYLYNSFNRRIMVPMEFLNEEDINAVISYIGFVSSSLHNEAGINGRTSLNEKSIEVKKYITNVTPSPADEKYFFKILFIIIASLTVLLMLGLTVKLFIYLSKEKETK